MKKLLLILLFLPVLAFADDFKIKTTSGNSIIALNPPQKLELGQKFYLLSDSLITGQAFVVEISDNYCILELSEGKAYAGDKLMPINQYDNMKQIIANKRLQEQQQTKKAQAKAFGWTIVAIVAGIFIYALVK